MEGEKLTQLVLVDHREAVWTVLIFCHLVTFWGIDSLRVG